MTGGITADDRARSTFEAAIRRDPGERGRASTTSSCCCAARVRPRRGRGRATAPGRWATGAAARARARRGGGTDVLASLTFLTPRGGLLALVALIPLAVLVVSTLRVERIARALGLPPASRRRQPLSPPLVRGSCAALLGLAAAQPAWRSTRAASSPHGVPGLLRRRRLALDGGRGRPIRADAPGAGSLPSSSGCATPCRPCPQASPG